MGDLNEDQPPPVAQPARTPAWELVIADCERSGVSQAVIDDMRERDKLGRERYGVPLTSHNGRDHLIDAYQEALDFVVYLRAWLDERGWPLSHTAPLPMEEMEIGNIYEPLLKHISVLRHFISRT